MDQDREDYAEPGSGPQSRRVFAAVALALAVVAGLALACFLYWAFFIVPTHRDDCRPVPAPPTKLSF